MGSMIEDVVRAQLLDRRQRLGEVLGRTHDPGHIENLLKEVDAALARLSGGTFGMCQTCREPIERERLLADPLACFCLDHLSPSQQRALEQDMELAALIQNSLLPGRNLLLGDFQVSYYYEAAGPVSGDYCDLVSMPDGSFYFMLGDIAGKGIAASMLMSNLHAVLRALVSVHQPLDQLLGRASRLFCESTLPMHFATLVCGKVTPPDEVELCNAGHVPPILLRAKEVTAIQPTALPIGMFCNQEFPTQRLFLEKNDSLVLATDGLSEARSKSGAEYGIERLARQAAGNHRLPPQALVDALVEDLRAFRGGAPTDDDVSIMAMRRVS